MMYGGDPPAGAIRRPPPAQMLFYYCAPSKQEQPWPCLGLEQQDQDSGTLMSIELSLLLVWTSIEQ